MECIVAKLDGIDIKGKVHTPRVPVECQSDESACTPRQEERRRVIRAINEHRYSDLTAHDYQRHHRLIRFMRVRANAPRPRRDNKDNRWIVTDDICAATVSQLALFPGACISAPRKRFPTYKGEETLIIEDTGSVLKMRAIESDLRSVGEGLPWRTGNTIVDGAQYRTRPKRVIVISRHRPCDIGFRYLGMEWRYNLE